MGKLVQFRAKFIHQNYHVDCLFESFKKARLAKNVISNIDEVDGIDCMKKSDIETIKSLIANFISTHDKPLPQEKKRTTKKVVLPILEESKQRKSKLKSTNIPSIKIMFTNTDQMTTTKMNELLKRIDNKKHFDCRDYRDEIKGHGRQTD